MPWFLNRIEGMIQQSVSNIFAMKNNSLIGPLSERWSPYSFSPEPVEPEKLISIFEAARRAPSSMNEQPWLFIFTDRSEPEVFGKYVDFLYDGNKAWAVYDPVLIVILARVNFLRNGKPKRHAFYDTGMAVANLLAQATAEGLYAHQMGGFYPERVKTGLGLDDSVEPVAMMALGYKGDGSGLSEELRDRDKVRRPRKNLSEFVFRRVPGIPAFGEDQK